MSDHELSLKDLFESLAPGTDILAPDSEDLTIAVGDLPEVDPATVIKEVRECVSTLLEVGVAEVMSGVWTKMKAVREAADPLKHAPDEIVVVVLARHTISSAHKPSVEVRVNDVPLATVPVTIKLSLTVEGLQLEIRDRRMRRVAAGQLSAKASLGVAGSTVLQGKTPTFDLPGRITLGADGISVPFLRPVDTAEPLAQTA